MTRGSQLLQPRRAGISKKRAALPRTNQRHQRQALKGAVGAVGVQRRQGAGMAGVDGLEEGRRLGPGLIDAQRTRLDLRHLALGGRRRLSRVNLDGRRPFGPDKLNPQSRSNFDGPILEVHFPVLPSNPKPGT